MRAPGRVTLASAAAIVVLLACTTPVPPTVTQPLREPVPAGAEIFVEASAQREAVQRSLEHAGIRLSDRWARDGYRLVVKVGSGRGNLGCGTTNNVSYALFRGDTRIMVIKGRGPTGACTPSIFDDMSRSLASYTAARAS